MAKKRKPSKKQLAALRRGRAKRNRGRFKVKRVGLRRYRKKGQKRKIKVLTVASRARRVRGESKRRTSPRKRKSPKRVAAGKKAAQTAKRRGTQYTRAKRRIHAAKRKRNPIGAAALLANPVKKKRKSAKRSAAAKKGAATRRRNARRTAITAAPAARRRKRKVSIRIGKRRYVCRPRKKGARGFRAYRRAAEESYDYRHDLPADSYNRSRRKSKSKRRRNPLPNPIRRRRSYSRRRNPLNPLPNPIASPMDFLGAVFGVGFGYVLASAADRYAAGHALTTVNGTLMDAPAAGQIYDSEAPQLPIWQNMERLGFAAGAVALPLVLVGVTKGAMRQTFALVSLGALVRTAGKAIEDAIATFGTTTPIVQQLYAPEIAAANRLATAGTTTALSQAAPNTFAGLPRGLGNGHRPHQLGMGDSGDCDPMPQGMITDPVADRGVFMAGQGQFSASPLSCGGCGCCQSCATNPPFNPLAPTAPPAAPVAPVAPPAAVAPPSNSFPMPLTPPPVAPPVVPPIFSTPGGSGSFAPTGPAPSAGYTPPATPVTTSTPVFTPYVPR